MSDTPILTHAEFYPPGHLGVVLATCSLDFHAVHIDLDKLVGLDAGRP